MKQNNRTMIDRYVYAVTSRLPQNQREDISLELRDLIDEMVQARTHEEEPILSVLHELGDPIKLADTYRGYGRYIIGPRYYDLFILVVKTVAFAVSLGMVIALSIGYLLNPSAQESFSFINMIGTIWSALLQAVAWVTVFFLIAQRIQQRKGTNEPSEDWSVEDLPDVPDNSTVIPRSDPIASMIFLTILGVLLYASPKIWGIVRNEVDVVIVNPVIGEVFMHMMPWFLVSILLDMCLEFAKLIIGIRTKQLALISILLHLLTAIISFYIVTQSGLWNPNFISELSQALHQPVSNFNLTAQLWNRMPMVLGLLIILGFVVDVGTTVKKTWFPRKF